MTGFVSLDTILAVLSIAIGLTIFLMQTRADAKINNIIKTQFRRQELEKKYFGTRLITNLELVKKNYLKLQQFLGEYLTDRSPASKTRVKNFSVFHSKHLDEYVVPTLRSDLGRLIQFIDDLELVDQLSSAFDDLSSIFKDCSVDSTLDEPDSSLREKISVLQERSKQLESLLSKLAREIPTIE
ncbi:MAG: hypothetical protein OK449_00180 [Thaumarchaeota archaeon]|nr:hypothetical protein [Nitrososphaerota archaeon]